MLKNIFYNHQVPVLLRPSQPGKMCFLTFDLRRYLLLTFDLQTFDLRRLLNLQPGTWNRTWNLELVNLRTVFLTFDGF